MKLITVGVYRKSDNMGVGTVELTPTTFNRFMDRTFLARDLFTDEGRRKRGLMRHTSIWLEKLDA